MTSILHNLSGWLLGTPKIDKTKSRQAPPIDFDDDNDSDSEIVIVDGLSKTHMADGKKLTLPQTMNKASDNDHAPPQFPELQPQSSTPARIQAKMPLQGNDFWPQTTHDLTESQMMGPCSKDAGTFPMNDQNLTLPTGSLRPHVQGSTSINGQMHTLPTDSLRTHAQCSTMRNGQIHTLPTDSLRPHAQGSTLMNGQTHTLPTDSVRPHAQGSTWTSGQTQTLPTGSLRSHVQGPQDIQATQIKGPTHSLFTESYRPQVQGSISDFDGLIRPQTMGPHSQNFQTVQTADPYSLTEHMIKTEMTDPYSQIPMPNTNAPFRSVAPDGRGDRRYQNRVQRREKDAMRYNGRTDWPDYLRHFEAVAKWNF